MQNNQMTTRKALGVLGLLILLVGLTFVVPARYVGIKKIKKQGLVLRTRDELADLRGDMDRNGIPDWKDMLINTTSSSTKEEAGKVVVDAAAKARLNDPNNITASFSKNIYMATAYAKQKGNLTVQEQEDLANQILLEEGAKLTFKEYTVKDLILIKKEDDASRKIYGNALGDVYKKVLTLKLTMDDSAVIEAYNTNKDPSVLESLVVKKNNLDTIITGLLEVKVPYSAAPYHLLLVNSLSEYESILDNVSQAKNDPMRAVIAYNAYNQTLQKFYSALVSIQNYFKLENMVFASNESGYIITANDIKK